MALKSVILNCWAWST